MLKTKARKRIRVDSDFEVLVEQLTQPQSLAYQYGFSRGMI
jgi:hypothetical protein